KAASRFQIELTDPQSCQQPTDRPIVYNLYPALGALNVQTVDATSRGFFLGSVLRWIAGGTNLSVQQQHDRMTAAMQQSIYISGYREETGDGPTKTHSEQPRTTRYKAIVQKIDAVTSPATLDDEHWSSLMTSVQSDATAADDEQKEWRENVDRVT